MYHSLQPIAAHARLAYSLRHRFLCNFKEMLLIPLSCCRRDLGLRGGLLSSRGQCATKGTRYRCTHSLTHPLAFAVNQTPKTTSAMSCPFFVNWSPEDQTQASMLGFFEFLRVDDNICSFLSTPHVHISQQSAVGGTKSTKSQHGRRVPRVPRSNVSRYRTSITPPVNDKPHSQYA
jgi:hypothetical protein